MSHLENPILETIPALSVTIDYYQNTFKSNCLKYVLLKRGFFYSVCVHTRDLVQMREFNRSKVCSFHWLGYSVLFERMGGYKRICEHQRMSGHRRMGGHYCGRLSGQKARRNPEWKQSWGQENAWQTLEKAAKRLVTGGKWQFSAIQGLAIKGLINY